MNALYTAQVYEHLHKHRPKDTRRHLWQDAAGSTMLKALERPREFNSLDEARAYYFKAAVRKYRRMLRQERRLGMLHDSKPFSRPLSMVADRALAGELEAFLAERYPKSIVLECLSGRSHDRIARRRNLTIDQVRYQKRRELEAIRANLGAFRTFVRARLSIRGTAAAALDAQVRDEVNRRLEP